MKNWKNEITATDIKDNDIHQAILNIMYNEWRTIKAISYEDMVRKFWGEYGDLAAFAVLIGKYNQQVCNGGHYQYFDNGYAGKNMDQDISLHKVLIDLFPIELLNEKDLFQNTIIQKVYTILNKFNVVLYNEEDIDDDDDYSDDIVANFNELEDLDNEYYEVSDQFMILLENFFEAKYHEPSEIK
jgi:hypothetical protein